MKPLWKWIVGIVVTLILVILGALWYLGNHWRPIFNEKLHEMALQASDSLYRVEYDDFDFNLVTGNAHIDNFRLIPDTAVYRQLKQKQKAPDNLYEVKIGKLVVDNFHPKRIYTERKLNIDEIRIENPEIKVINETQPYNDTLKTRDRRTLYQRISGVLKELTVHHIAFENVGVTYSNRSGPKEKTTRLRNVNINISDLKVDSLSEVDSMRFYHARAIDVNMDNYRIATGDSLYYIDVKGMHFTSVDRTIVLDGLKLMPRYNKVDFYKQTKMARDRFDLLFDTISIARIDLFKLFKQQKLFAKQVKIGRTKLDIFNNKTYPKGKKEPKIGQFPHQQLQRLALPLKIDTLLLDKADITYGELNGKSRQIGKISFNDSHIVFYNITNDSATLKSNRYLTADIHTKFMNQGKFNVHFEFDLLDELGAFSYQGALGYMDARSLNAIVKPLAMVEISSGNLRRLSFNIRANEQAAKGNVQFYYNKLNVNIIVEEKDGKKAKSGMFSVLTNKFLLNDSNPDANEVYHPGMISYRRPPDASFFNFIWKSLFEGVKASVGIDKEREAKLRSTAQNADKAAGKVKRFFNNLFKKKDKEQ